MAGLGAYWRGLALGLALVAPQPGAASPVVLTAEQMKTQTIALIRQGKPAEALAFAEALLKSNPQDSTVLTMKSRAERDLGRNDAAVRTARLAWKHATNGQQRYGASMAVAQGLSSGGHKFAAQLWLRRAISEAQNPTARQIAKGDFQYVRNRSRLSLRFDGSVQPSSNVNNGSSSAILHFLGLPFVLSGDAQALSGLEASVGVTARYTLAESTEAKTALRFGASQQLVRLSAAARAQAPTARNGDYAFGGIELGLDYSRKIQPLAAEMVSSVSFGKNWYGGAPLSNYARLDLVLNKAFAPDWQGFGKLSGERQDRLDSADRSATIATVGFGLRHGLGNGDQITVALNGQDVQSSSGEIDHNGYGARLDWSRGKPVAGTRLSAGLSLDTADYAVSPYALGGRQDKTLGASISVAFEQVDYMGFIPVMTIEASRTTSNIELYQRNSLGVGLSVQSKF